MKYLRKCTRYKGIDPNNKECLRELFSDTGLNTIHLIPQDGNTDDKIKIVMTIENVDDDFYIIIRSGKTNTSSLTLEEFNHFQNIKLWETKKEQ